MAATRSFFRIVCATALSVCLQPFGVAASETAASFQVTSGVCGSVVFAQRIASDYRSALQEMERRLSNRQTVCAGRSGCRLEPFEIGVDGSPGTHFYALKVVDIETGMLDHGVTEVITSDGRLFAIRWCPD